ncbi:MAG TPA: hypothetical protein VG167_14120, partial [Verrucomicrobiae bacterium]|nr:hypothetical protein [Verrucomicrobiae bacterium]
MRLARALCAGVQLALRTWLAALLWALAAGLAGARAAETTHLSGHEYLRLTEWARANHLAVAWLKRDELLQLGNGSTKLLLTIDSREAQFNGVHLWLSFPIVQREAKLFLARIDAQETFEPLLVPPRNARGA